MIKNFLNRALYLVKIFSILFLILLVISLVFDPTPLLGSLFLLLFGWINFISIVFPKIQLNPEMLILGLFTLIVLAVGVHLLMTSFRPHWRLKWSLTGLAFFMLMFVTSITITGALHQLIWLTKEPILVSKYDFYERGVLTNMKAIGIALNTYSKEHGHFPKAYQTINLQELAPLLEYEGTYLDDWGIPFKYTSDGYFYTLRSYGANGVLGSDGSNQFDDLIYSNGKWIQ